MKTKSILFTLTVIFFAGLNAHAQDPVFSQWENMSLYVNPALTGNFDGILRLSALYRNQWQSLLKDNSYRTSDISAEYKFPAGSVHKFSIGMLGIHDKAGSLDFQNNGMNLSASVIQILGHPDLPHHSIAFGFNLGLATRKIDFENAQWPGGMPPTDLVEKKNFADVSTGLLWQFRSNTHFSFQVGGALNHFNTPNISFYENSNEILYSRFHLHGNVEIPLVDQFSMIPSFLLTTQGPSKQLLFGFHSRWYPRSIHSNFVQLGIFGHSSNNFNGWATNAYVLSATVEINSFLLGFSFDRYTVLESNAYEFSAGYTFGKSESKDKAINRDSLPEN